MSEDNQLTTGSPVNFKQDGEKQVCELEAEIQSCMTSALRSLQTTDVDATMIKKKVLHLQGTLEKKLKDSTWNIIQEIDNHVIQDKSTLTNNVKKLRSLLERSRIVRRMADDPVKQKQIDTIKRDWQTQEQCQYSTGLFIDFELSPIATQLLADGVTLGKINIQTNKKPYCPMVRLPQMDIYHAVTNGNDTDTCTLNCEKKLKPGECIPLTTNYLNGYRRRSSESNLNDNWLKKDAEINYQLALLGHVSDEIDLALQVGTHPKCQRAYDQNVNRGNQLNKNTVDKTHKEYNRAGCGYVYRDEWQPNILYRPRSIDEMSFHWSSSHTSSSDNSSLSDNCAYPQHMHNSDFAKRIEIKELNVTQANNNGQILASASSPNIHLCTAVKCIDNIATISSQIKNTSLNCRFSSIFETKHHRTPCVIHDITWLRNNQIILTDHYHNNIQLFDETFNFIAEESCPYPMGICSIDKVPDVAAVALRRSGSIAIFKADHRQIKRQRLIKVACEYYIWNVVYKSGRLFVICDENNIHMLDLNGKEHGIIHLGISTECGYIRNYDVSNDGRTFYLCTETGLICVNRDGDHIWRFTMDTVPGKKIDRYSRVLESVCLFDDRLLATQWTQNIIVEISLDGRFVQHLVTEGLEHPRAMVIRNGKLAVTQFNPTMNENKKRTVKIFDLVFE